MQTREAILLNVILRLSKWLWLSRFSDADEDHQDEGNNNRDDYHQVGKEWLLGETRVTANLLVVVPVFDADAEGVVVKCAANNFFLIVVNEPGIVSIDKASVSWWSHNVTWFAKIACWLLAFFISTLVLAACNLEIRWNGITWYSLRLSIYHDPIAFSTSLAVLLLCSVIGYTVCHLFKWFCTYSVLEYKSILTK